MTEFRIATRSYIDANTNTRAGEIKLGETVQCAGTDNWEDDLKDSEAKFVLLGIPEDIGVRANHGVGGAHTLWEPALKVLLNVQHTTKLPGNRLFVLGSFDFTGLMQTAENQEATDMRDLVTQIDNEVYPIIQKIVSAGKVPVIIGGGHNNAYPILKGVAAAKGGSVNCINLDAHSDYRRLEGRHSGNGFRYAKTEGYLDRYAAVGLHENYNAEDIVNEFALNKDLHCSFFEDIFIHGKLTFAQSVRDAMVHTAGKTTGIELDLDCIEYVLSSAATPCGITALQARQYITMCAQYADAGYLHITEGAVSLRNRIEDTSTAPKLVAYLVTDFLKAFPNP